MSPARVVVVMVALACLSAARPVRRTLNFNMFVLRPRPNHPDRLLVSTDGVSRFGPILEYLVQRVQGMMSVKNPPEPSETFSDLSLLESLPPTSDVPDTSENEVDGIQETKKPGVVVRPSRTKPGTYEVEIDVVVDDGQPQNPVNAQHNL